MSTPTPTRVSVHPPAARAWTTLAAGVLVVVCASLAAAFSAKVLGHDWVHGLIPRLDLDNERSLGTWVSSVQLLTCGALFGVVYALKRGEGDRFARHWLGLCVMLVLMSMEEVADFHNMDLISIRAATRISPYLHYSWVILGFAFVLAAGATYTRFLLALPLRTRLHLLLSAAVYFGGAIGFELLGGKLAALGGLDSWASVFTITAEESMELIGEVTLAASLLAYIAATYGRATLHFVRPDAAATHAAPTLVRSPSAAHAQDERAA